MALLVRTGAVLGAPGRAYSTPALCGIVSQFPPVEFAMAYGSGVMRHGAGAGGAADDAMVDLIFGVRDAAAWHRANLERGHAHHYSWPARLLGAERIAALQRTAAGLHFNPFVRWDRDTVVKYGVIAVDDLVHDLQHWTTLYVSGRLHKPANILQAPVQVRDLMQRNWRLALHAALLLLPSGRWTDRDLFQTIAGLSYAGDIRMKLGFAENPRKVPDIVQANLGEFRRLYGAFIAEAESTGFLHRERPPLPASSDGTEFTLNLDPAGARSILAQMPERVRQLCFADLHPAAAAARSAEPSAWTGANLVEMRRALRRAIDRIGLEATFWQSLKGLYTAGIRKSIAYAYRKSIKSLKR